MNEPKTQTCLNSSLSKSLEFELGLDLLVKLSLSSILMFWAWDPTQELSYSYEAYYHAHKWA